MWDLQMKIKGIVNQISWSVKYVFFLIPGYENRFPARSIRYIQVLGYEISSPSFSIYLKVIWTSLLADRQAHLSLFHYLLRCYSSLCSVMERSRVLHINVPLETGDQ